MADRELPPLPAPVVPASRRIDEITIKGVVLGLVIAMLMAAANAYLGLRIGMTVAASIPAAAISLGVLRFFRKSTILENNQVQTVASAGASTVSGIIFTVPALVMMGYWQDYRYLPICLFVLIGGIMGVVFTTPLRRALIVDARLAFPEGVATAEVLKTGPVEREAGTETKNDAAARGFRRLLQAAGLGAVFKLLDGAFGVVAEEVRATAGLFGGNWLFRVEATLAPSLLGVGWIVGLNIGVLMMSGAVLGTLIATPLNWLHDSAHLMAAAGIAPGTPFENFTAENWSDVVGKSWGECRRIGIGCMIVGGIWSLITLAKPLVSGVRASLAAFRAARGGQGAAIERTEYDTPFPIILGVALVMAIPLFFTFRSVLEGRPDANLVAAITTVMMLIFGFLFCSVAGYMAGLVGSSNNPVSGVTMSTVIVSALVLVQIMGRDGTAAQLGPAIVIYLAAMICTAACIAGDNLQDLKCGHLVGSTPWKQQICLVIGAVGSALVIPWVLGVLDESSGIGHVIKEGVKPLDAPQATLMFELATGIFGQGIAWNYILIGCGLAVALITLDQIQKRRGSSFRFPVLAVAVGIYLPFGLSVLIFLGGLLSHIAMKRAEHAPKAAQQNQENAGLLLASGLITGEAVMGVLIAIIAVNLKDGLPQDRPEAAYVGLVAMLLLVVYLYRKTTAALRD